MSQHLSKNDAQMANRHMKKKMLTITSHQGNYNKNPNEVLPNPREDDYFLKIKDEC